MRILTATPVYLLLAMLPLGAQVPGINAPPAVPAVPDAPVPLPFPPGSPVPGTPTEDQSPAPAPDPAVNPPATAEPATVEARLENSTLSMGEDTTLSFNFTEGRPEAPPQSLTVGGLVIRLLGVNSSAVSINGKVRVISQLTYTVEALEAGEKIIPEQSFSVGGREIKSKAVTLQVKDGEPIDESMQPQAQISLAKTEMWEGEAVQISARVLMHRMINIISQPVPVITSDGIAVSRFDRMNGGVDMLNIGDELWNSWTLQSALIPIKNGSLTVGPGEVKLEVYMPVLGAQRDPFGGGRATRRALKVKTNSLAIKVKPLPADGCPENFNGLVGDFRVSARAETSGGATPTIELGELIPFEITVTGIGNFDAVAPPGLDNAQGLRAYKARTAMENRGLGTEPGQKSFTQIVLPEKPGPLSVIYALPYFDPQTGKYGVAKSQSVNFMVVGDPEKLATEKKAADSQTKDYTGVIEAMEPGEELQDILPHTLRGGRWYNLAAISPPVHPLFLHGAPAVFLLGLLGIGARKRYLAWQAANRPPARAPRQCGEIAAALRAPGLSRLQFYSLVSEYIHAWTFWKKPPPPLPSNAAWAELLSARDRWLYAANAEAAAAPVAPDEQSAATATLVSRLSA